MPLGLVSGYFGGWLDRILVLIMDALFAFPYLLLAIVIAFLLRRPARQAACVTAALAITAVYIPQYFRVVRNHGQRPRGGHYVEAARALGARPDGHRPLRVQNVIQSVPVIATLNAADAILTLAALGFLGSASSPPRPPSGATTCTARSTTPAPASGGPASTRAWRSCCSSPASRCSARA